MCVCVFRCKEKVWQQDGRVTKIFQVKSPAISDRQSGSNESCCSVNSANSRSCVEVPSDHSHTNLHQSWSRGGVKSKRWMVELGM